MLNGIPPTREEEQRLGLLRILAQEITAVTGEASREGLAWILKGGTALVFALGLPRPSTDLDYEGERRRIRRQIKMALKRVRAGGDWTETKLGMDWLLRGTMEIRARTKEGNVIVSGIDHRPPGWRNIPEKLPYERTMIVDGILMYDEQMVVEKKLHTMIGEMPRWKPRDLYDAAWLVVNRPDLLPRESAQELQEAMRRERHGRILGVEQEWKVDRVMRRADPAQTYEILLEAVSIHEAGTKKKEEHQDKPGPKGRARVRSSEAGPTWYSKSIPGQEASSGEKGREQGTDKKPGGIEPGC